MSGTPTMWVVDTVNGGDACVLFYAALHCRFDEENVARHEQGKLLSTLVKWAAGTLPCAPNRSPCACQGRAVTHGVQRLAAMHSPPSPPPLWQTFPTITLVLSSS